MNQDPTLTTESPEDIQKRLAEDSKVFPRFRILWASLFFTTCAPLVVFYFKNPEAFQLRVDFQIFLQNLRESELPFFKLFSIMAMGNLFLGALLPKLLVKIAWVKEGKRPLGMKAYLVPFLVRLALYESVSLLGFILGFAFTGDLNDYLPFLMGSQFFFLRYFPLTPEKVKSGLNPYPDHIMRGNSPQ
jgi:hypothetical protein